jgi:hypothetical protein
MGKKKMVVNMDDINEDLDNLVNRVDELIESDPYSFVQGSIHQRNGLSNGCTTESGEKKKNENIVIGSEKTEMSLQSRAKANNSFLPAIKDTKELGYFLERQETYKGEFELNNSVDDMLVSSLVLEEILHRRLLSKAINETNGDNGLSAGTDFALTNNHKRMILDMKSLGILREQRLMMHRNDNGVNLAELVSKFDKATFTLEYNKKKDSDIAEEERMMRVHSDRTPDIIDVEPEIFDEVSDDERV